LFGGQTIGRRTKDIDSVGEKCPDFSTGDFGHVSSLISGQGRNVSKAAFA